MESRDHTLETDPRNRTGLESRYGTAMDISEQTQRSLAD